MATNQRDPSPIDEIRIGAVKAAIWPNDSEGGVFHTTTFERVYRTSDGEWRSSRSFGERHLLLLAKVADAAHTRIHQLRLQQRPEDER